MVHKDDDENKIKEPRISDVVSKCYIVVQDWIITKSVKDEVQSQKSVWGQTECGVGSAKLPFLG